MSNKGTQYSDANLRDLVLEVKRSSASFYRDIWGNTDRFEELPPVDRSVFVAVPLSKRRYAEGRSLVKMVHAKEGIFLSEWRFSDIAAECYGDVGQRPLVYLADPHEAIEKSLWCYDQGVVPLIGEKDPDIAMYAAEKYEIDSLVTDPAAIANVRPYLEKRTTKLRFISIIAPSFAIADLMPYRAFARTVTLVRALPEIGAIESASLEKRPRFAPCADCVIERDETLIVTKTRMLVTPVIRYRTDIAGDSV